ncbi:MAG: FG-GAP-like repeat-containing protein [Pseudomonadota bacterium]
MSDLPNLPNSAYSLSFNGPSAAEQYMVELVNRARLDPSAEAGRQGTGLGNTSAAEREVLAVVAPLDAAAQFHSDQIIEFDFFAHTNPNTGSTPSSRARDFGYGSGAGENIALAGGFGSANRETQATIDGHHVQFWNSIGHRENFLRSSYAEIGIGQTVGDFSGFGPNSSNVTQMFGNRGINYVTGVVIDDRDNDQFYDIGEGQGGVRITAFNNQTAVATSTWASGGYSLALSAGTYTIVFEGGELDGRVERTVTIGSTNVKLDVFENQAQAAPPPPPPPQLGNVTGRFYTDADDDGIRDPQAIDPGVAGHLVQLIKGSQVIAATTTSNQGWYTFSNIAADSGYYIRFFREDAQTEFKVSSGQFIGAVGNLNSATFSVVAGSTIPGPDAVLAAPAPAPGESDAFVTTLSRFSGTWWGEREKAVADVNGDGSADIIGFTGIDQDARALVQLAGTDGGFGGFVHTQTRLGMDWWSPREKFFADVNNDDRIDIVGLTGIAGDERVLVQFGETNGSFGDIVMTQSRFGGTWWGVRQKEVADVNGDGFADLIGLVGIEQDQRVLVQLGQSDGTFGAFVHSSSRFSSNFWSVREKTFADVNGDNRVDIIGFTGLRNDDRVMVQLGQQDGSFGNYIHTETRFGNDWWAVREKFVADVNGDNRADIIGFVELDSDQRVMVQLGQSDGSFGPLINSQTGFGSAVWANREKIVADVNGDRRADIVGFTNSDQDQVVYTALGQADGTFSVPTTTASAAPEDQVFSSTPDTVDEYF